MKLTKYFIKNLLIITLLIFLILPIILNLIGYHTHENFEGYDMEGKQTKLGEKDTDFHCESYLNRYADLKRAFGNNCEKAKSHWNSNGKREGRNAGLEKEKVKTVKKENKSKEVSLTKKSVEDEVEENVEDVEDVEDEVETPVENEIETINVTCNMGYTENPKDGDRLCCGQPGSYNSLTSRMCPSEYPICSGYICGEKWGKCQKNI